MDCEKAIKKQIKRHFDKPLESHGLPAVTVRNEVRITFQFHLVVSLLSTVLPAFGEGNLPPHLHRGLYLPTLRPYSSRRECIRRTMIWACGKAGLAKARAKEAVWVPVERFFPA